jgi:Beta-lactamase
LHRSVKTYLNDLHVSEERGVITLHHLLTHTAGFDERLTGMAARSAEAVQPLAHYLARSMPPTFIEPGRVISYSNHGFGLVGLLLWIPVITAFMGVAVSVAVVARWRDRRTSAAVLGDAVVAIALLSFVVFAWYWNLVPTQDL